MDKIVLTGGGTGGHIMPIVAIVRELRMREPSLQLHYIGPKSDFEALEQEGFANHAIAAGKMRRYFDWQNFIDLPLKIPFSFLQAFFLLLIIRPSLVFSKGGTSSLPVTFSARILRIPVFLHESDVYPGLSNRIASRWARKVFVSFENTEYFDQKKIIITGNPVRKSILEAQNALDASPTSSKSAILVMGGSQGATAINNFILLVLNNLLAKYEVIHVAGPNNYKRAKVESAIILPENVAHYHIYPTLNEIELKNAYASADIIISRAGSGSIFELAAMGKPSIMIPLPRSSNDHQSKNAYQYAKSGATIVIEQESLSPSYFLGEIESVILKSEKMRAAALNFAKPEAAESIAKEIIKYVK